MTVPSSGPDRLVPEDGNALTVLTASEEQRILVGTELDSADDEFRDEDTIECYMRRDRCGPWGTREFRTRITTAT
ncbi:hypothetical protein ACIA78_21610 [Streptomyces xanthochromogenes]|uniref:hypothetical protein n=1 Tax=Streptomyces xanthochromogenes TaxID=67384 RepID=UPI00378A153E